MPYVPQTEQVLADVLDALKYVRGSMESRGIGTVIRLLECIWICKRPLARAEQCPIETDKGDCKRRRISEQDGERWRFSCLCGQKSVMWTGE